MALPYSKHAAIFALLLAWGILALLHVKSILGFVAGTVLIWIPLSLYLNASSFRYKTPILKKWEPRRQRRYKSFFEWLYERDRPPHTFDKRDK